MFFFGLRLGRRCAETALRLTKTALLCGLTEATLLRRLPESTLLWGRLSKTTRLGGLAETTLLSRLSETTCGSCTKSRIVETTRGGSTEAWLAGWTGKVSCLSAGLTEAGLSPKTRLSGGPETRLSSKARLSRRAKPAGLAKTALLCGLPEPRLSAITACTGARLIGAEDKGPLTKMQGGAVGEFDLTLDGCSVDGGQTTFGENNQSNAARIL